MCNQNEELSLQQQIAHEVREWMKFHSPEVHTTNEWETIKMMSLSPNSLLILVQVDIKP